jgi:hypothetical protein
MLDSFIQTWETATRDPEKLVAKLKLSKGESKSDNLRCRPQGGRGQVTTEAH